jgi:hypothetical protein
VPQIPLDALERLEHLTSQRLLFFAFIHINDSVAGGISESEAEVNSCKLASPKRTAARILDKNLVDSS